jgi:hypothetical protein
LCDKGCSPLSCHVMPFFNTLEAADNTEKAVYYCSIIFFTLSPSSASPRVGPQADRAPAPTYQTHLNQKMTPLSQCDGVSSLTHCVQSCALRTVSLSLGVGGGCLALPPVDCSSQKWMRSLHRCPQPHRARTLLRHQLIWHCPGTAAFDHIECFYSAECTEQPECAYVNEGVSVCTLNCYVSYELMTNSPLKDCTYTPRMHYPCTDSC